MILLKTIHSKSNPQIPHSLQRCIFFSDASTQESKPNFTALSSLFATNPSKPSQIKKNPISDEPSLQAPTKSTTLSALFARKPIKNSHIKAQAQKDRQKAKREKLPSKKQKGVSPTNEKVPEKDAKPSRREKLPKKGEKKVGPTYKPLEEKEFPKQLSEEATLFVSRLIEDGYLKDANFVKGEDKLEAHEIPRTEYARTFLKTAAGKFGQEHQEIAKWLSGGELKKVALFGCPSTELKSVYAAKRLRSFFHIQEEIVCRGCTLKNSCKHINKKTLAVDKVVLEDVMRLLTLYSLDGIPLQLVIPDELKLSINKLMKEAVSLSEQGEQK